jgi:hypothetical protein
MLRPELALPVLFREVSARQEARAVSASGLYVRKIYSPERWAAAGEQSHRARTVSETALDYIAAASSVPEGHGNWTLAQS